MTTIGGLPARQLTYFDGLKLKMEGFVIKDDKLYTLNFDTKQLRVPETLPIGQKMLQSFRFQTQSSTPPSTSAGPIATQVPQGQLLQQIPSTPDSFKNNDNKTCSDLKNSITDLDSAMNHPRGLTAEQYQTLQKAKADYSNSGCTQ